MRSLINRAPGGHNFQQIKYLATSLFVEGHLIENDLIEIVTMEVTSIVTLSIKSFSILTIGFRSYTSGHVFG